MSPKSKRLATILSLFLVFSVSQVYLGVSFAGPGPATARSESPTLIPQQPTGILSTQGNNSITVNGATAASGATMVSGASIETPSKVSASVNLGSRGSLQIEPNTILTLVFDETSVKVTLIQGCVTLRTKKGTAGEVVGTQGVIGRTGPANDGKVETCPQTPAAAVIPATTIGGVAAMGTAGTLGLIGGITLIVLPIILGGRNPSPSG